MVFERIIKLIEHQSEQTNNKSINEITVMDIDKEENNNSSYNGINNNGNFSFSSNTQNSNKTKININSNIIKALVSFNLCKDNLTKIFEKIDMKKLDEMNFKHWLEQNKISNIKQMNNNSSITQMKKTSSSYNDIEINDLIMDYNKHKLVIFTNLKEYDIEFDQNKLSLLKRLKIIVDVIHLGNDNKVSNTITSIFVINLH